MKRTKNFLCIKDLFSGQFWNGASWIVISEYSDVIRCSIEAEDFLEESNNIPDLDNRHIVLTEVVVNIDIIY